VDPKNPEAVNTVFKIKKRSPEKPLPILAARVEQLSGIVNIDDIAQKITDAFWPGELTIVFDLLPNANIELSPREFALDTVAVRVTKHPIASAILEKTGALATTSANISGSANLSSISEIKAQLGSNVAVYVNDTLPARPLTDTLTDTHAASAHTNTADTLPARPRTDPADTRLARPLTDSADTSPSSTTLTPSTIIDISQFSTERPFKVLREGNITKEQILRELN
jgi:tRNA threonylcarbamoyl adenosine modification protein (Sua5/YciO/YrdC/YwlC family)